MTSIIYEQEAKSRILAGAQKLANTVAVTLGPCGKNVLIDEGGSVHSTKDGVTVAEKVQLEDEFENVGASAVKEAARKSADRVGDGTTTSTVLAFAILKEGLKYVQLGSNATSIKNGIKAAADEAAAYVKGASIPVKSKEDIRRVAMVSANGDAKIGDIISDVMDKIGSDGTIRVEEGRGLDMASKVVKGMVIDRSYESPYMVTDPETMESVLENPFVLVVDGKISSFKDILPCLQAVSQSGRPLFLIADSYAEDVLASLVMNRMRGGLQSLAIASPSYGDNRSGILNDIATLCGGRVVSEKNGVRFSDALPGTGVLGAAKQVVANRQNTVIVDGAGAPDQVAKLASSLRARVKSETDEYEVRNVQERLARLMSGVGVITFGAATEAERKELRDRVDDAFCASKAAQKGGVVSGGGSALLQASVHLEKWIKGQDFDPDVKIGCAILQEALKAPIRRIIENAGKDASYVIEYLRGQPAGTGYNVVTGAYVDMVDDGVIDPTDVVVNEIVNSASVASVLLMTEAVVVDKPKK